MAVDPKQTSNGPLLGIKAFATRKLDSASASVEDIFGKDAKQEVEGAPNAFGVHFTGTVFGAVALCKSDVSSWSFTRNLNGLVHIALPLTGSPLNYQSGARHHEVFPTRGAAVGYPFETINMKIARGSGIGLCAPIDGLIERAESLTGILLGKAWLSEMADYIALSAPICAALARNMKAATVEIARLNSIGMSALALVGMEDLLMNLAAASLFPTVARKVGETPPDCGPAVIRRARDHINEHAADPIDFSRLANDLGISMRAMQANFRKYFGVSPRDYLLECRLERTREHLLLAGVNSSVTSVALASGFTDLSHFSMKYRKRYGELPSATLRSALRRF